MTDVQLYQGAFCPSAFDQWQDRQIEIVGGTGNGQTRTVASNTNNTITVTAAWATNPDDTSVYTVRRGAEFRIALDHPNATSEYELTNRGAFRAMFFEGDEDCGVSSSSVAPADMLIDSTKAWADNAWNGTGADARVLIYHANGTVSPAEVSDTFAEDDDLA